MSQPVSTLNSLLCFVDEHFYYWHGWDLQYKWIRELYANLTLADRQPQAIWRGRVADDDYPERDALRYGRLPGTSCWLCKSLD